jgi:hypothetical protein
MTIRRSLLRALLICPLVLLLIAALLVASMSPFDFSSNRLVRLPLWVLSLNPLIVSLPVLVAGGWGVAMTIRNTRQRFHVAFPWVILGLGGVLMFVAALVETSRQDLEHIFAFGGIAGASIHASASLLLTLGLLVIFVPLLFGMVYLYCICLVADGSGRHERRPDEPDATGLLIQEMRSRRSLPGSPPPKTTLNTHG